MSERAQGPESIMQMMQGAQVTGILKAGVDLGVFTEITLRLLPKPAQVATLLALYTDVHAAGASVSRLIAAGLVPRCIEMMDAATLQAVRAAGNAIDRSGVEATVAEFLSGGGQDAGAGARGGGFAGGHS